MKKELDSLNEELEDLKESADDAAEVGNMFALDLLWEDILITLGEISDLEKKIKELEE